MTGRTRRRLAGLSVLLPLAFAGSALAAPPSNDDFSDAQRITAPGVYESTVLDATAELGERPIVARPPRRSVWFRYRSPCTCDLVVDTGGSRFDSVLAVYTGATLDELSLVGEDDDGSPVARRGAVVEFRARKGRTYRFAVDSWDADVPPEDSQIVLTVSDGSIAGDGVSMTVAEGQTVDRLRRKGLGLTVSARRANRVRVELLVTRRASRRLGLATTRLGRLSGSLDYGQTLRGTLPLTTAARRALRGEPRLTATLRLTLAGDAPNRVLRLPVRLGA